MTALIFFAVCAALASGCTSARSGQAGKANPREPDSVCILQDDFENDQPPFLRHAGESPNLKIVSGNEALSGKRSLCMDSMGSSQEWIIGAELSKGLRLIPGKGYAVEFKHLLADTANQSAENFFSVAGPKGHFYARTAFAAAPGQKGVATFTFVLPDDATNAVLRFSSHGACRTLIDDIKVKRLPPRHPRTRQIRRACRFGRRRARNRRFHHRESRRKMVSQGSGGQSLLVGRHHLRRQFPGDDRH